MDSDSDDDAGNNMDSTHEDQTLGDDSQISSNDGNLEDKLLGDSDVHDEILWNYWAAMGTFDVDSASDSDTDSEINTGEAPYPQLEDDGDDSDDGESTDWDAIEMQSGLSAWDQLGERYEADAATMGKFCSI